MSIPNPLQPARQRGSLSVVKQRPQKPKEGTVWSNSTTGIDEVFSGGLWKKKTIAGGLQSINNLSDLASASTARTNLGLGTLSTQNANSVNFSGSVRLGGSVAKSGTYSMGSTDCVVNATTGAGGWTLTLPLANSANQIVIIRKIDNGAGALTIAVSGSDTIEGSNSASLASQYDKIILQSDGVGTWYKLSP